MPFNLTNKPIKNLPKDFSSKQKQVATSAANSALDNGKEEGAAIAIGVAAGKRTKSKNGLIDLFKKFITSLPDEFENITDDKIDQYLSDSLPEINKSTSIEIVKQFEDEQMIAFEPLYINTGKADTDGDGVTDASLDQLIDNFNLNIDTIKSFIHHSYETDSFHPIKAYRMPMDVHVGDLSDPSNMTLIKEGQPVVQMKFTDKSLWEKRKSGILGSVSIGCKAKQVPNPDYIENQ